MNADDRTRAWRRARRLYPNSKNFRATYMRGVEARSQGKPIDACPYAPGGATWRQAYRLAWLRGWQSIPEEEVI